MTPGAYINVMKLSVYYSYFMGFLGGTVVKHLPANVGATGDAGSVLGSGRSPGGDADYHCSILAWRIPWTEDPGGPQYMGS